jgi:hypothetical protein
MPVIPRYANRQPSGVRHGTDVAAAQAAYDREHSSPR